MSSTSNDSMPPASGSNESAGGKTPAEPTQSSRPRELSSSSGDDLSLSLAAARPDPMLGEFVEAPAGEKARGPAPGASPGGSFDPLTGVVPPTPATSPLVDSADALASLGVDTGMNLLDSATASSTRPVVDGPSHDPTSPVEAEEEDVDEQEEPPGKGSWIMILLASYASAVTIGLIWVLASGRRLPESTTTDASAFEATGDVGRRADRSQRLVVPRREAASHVVELGQTVRLGAIEVTPLSVSRGNVRLERLLRPGTIKDGGGDALILRLRFRNVSPDVVIAPLDEAYLREREPGQLDSYIDPGPGRPTIEMYPLAVDSEWSIVGQDFRDLGPSESYETQVVSAPGAAEETSGGSTWRLRLRTGINQTDELDIRFDAGKESRPSPPRPATAKGRGS